MIPLKIGGIKLLKIENSTIVDLEVKRKMRLRSNM